MNGREVEWQLACTDLGSVRRWLADHGTIDGLVLEPRATQQRKLVKRFTTAQPVIR